MKPRIVISACLLGQAVRYDCGHKLDWPVVAALERYCEFIPVCPEKDCGMGVPREPMRLEGPAAFPRLVTVTGRVDKTEQLEAWTSACIIQLREEHPAGFVFKSRSPSCGLMTAIYDYRSCVIRAGAGLFARRVTLAFPDLPAVEAESLHSAAARKNFLARVSSNSGRVNF